MFSWLSVYVVIRLRSYRLACFRCGPHHLATASRGHSVDRPATVPVNDGPVKCECYRAVVGRRRMACSTPRTADTGALGQREAVNDTVVRRRMTCSAPQTADTGALGQRGAVNDTVVRRRMACSTPQTADTGALGQREAVNDTVGRRRMACSTPRTAGTGALGQRGAQCQGQLSRYHRSLAK